MLSLTLFILGLIIGSFLNVVVYRLKKAESIVFGGSKCPKCQAKIKWYDNIPAISFFILHFRCRNCREKISWQYPMLEISTGLLFAIAGSVFFSWQDLSTSIMLAYSLTIISLLLIIFVFDWLYMEIPGIVLWIGIILAVIFNFYFDWSGGFFSGDFLAAKTYAGLLGGGIAFIFFFSMSYFSKEKWMGMGDSYLAIFLGLFLGFPRIFYALIIGFFLGAFLGIILIIFGKKKMKSKLPLAPFLIAGTLLVMFFYPQIAAWYWGLFYF
jgi:leader peptidase (prepilin peptidase) / N-methyltransferase